MVGVYCENLTKHINTLCGVAFNVKASVTTAFWIAKHKCSDECLSKNKYYELNG
jgi:hypothetical protein